MISYEKAKNIVIKASKEHQLSLEMVKTEQAVGRVCSMDINAPINIQPFDNSAMDGFAIRVSDLNENGGVLRRSYIIAAGDNVPTMKVASGHCVEIMTGAPIPADINAVVPIELVEINGDKISFKERPKLGANIRRAGEDFKKGMSVLRSGQMIYPQHIMPLAALGIANIEVYKPPKIMCLTTGLELVDDLSKDLKSGQIYNSNGPYIKDSLNSFGIKAICGGTVADDEQVFQDKLLYILENNIDITISTGAVSAGKFDFIRDGLEKAGAEILFHKVSMKPGKPNLFARLPNGSLYFGLPGNPVSSAVGLRFFVQTSISTMMGMKIEDPIYALSTTSFKKRSGFKMFLKAQAISNDKGILNVNLLDGQASFMAKPFLDMNCWAIAPEDSVEIKVGDVIELYPLYPNSGFL